MHHPDDTFSAGPAGLALPLALVASLAERSAERNTDGPPRAAELRTTGSRERRAARRRATAVRG
ncbi:hypothetical protein EES39_13055 [Streptomyces sp. ADI92-24]|uniref:hypothetical protein n=1 Tax=Streptomyces TaxID=1883 RepID=UPI000F54F26E|nr:MULTISPECIES: hypothetical protein [Streptomyces]MBO0918800.1 hypothetical protein [Streptomyces laculatispora]RPK46679.1 hypothetical protein EES39_13055 [Streptomyces sp. ADI92-24]